MHHSIVNVDDDNVNVSGDQLCPKQVGGACCSALYKPWWWWWCEDVDDDDDDDDNDDDDDDNDDDDVFGVKKQVGGRVPSQLTSLTLQPTL